MQWDRALFPADRFLDNTINCEEFTIFFSGSLHSVSLSLAQQTCSIGSIPQDTSNSRQSVCQFENEPSSQEIDTGRGTRKLFLFRYKKLTRKQGNGSWECEFKFLEEFLNQNSHLESLALNVTIILHNVRTLR